MASRRPAPVRTPAPASATPDSKGAAPSAETKTMKPRPAQATSQPSAPGPATAASGQTSAKPSSSGTNKVLDNKIAAPLAASAPSAGPTLSSKPEVKEIKETKSAVATVAAVNAVGQGTCVGCGNKAAAAAPRGNGTSVHSRPQTLAQAAARRQATASIQSFQRQARPASASQQSLVRPSVRAPHPPVPVTASGKGQIVPATATGKAPVVNVASRAHSSHVRVHRRAPTSTPVVAPSSAPSTPKPAKTSSKSLGGGGEEVKSAIAAAVPAGSQSRFDRFRNWFKSSSTKQKDLVIDTQTAVTMTTSADGGASPPTPGTPVATDANAPATVQAPSSAAPAADDSNTTGAGANDNSISLASTIVLASNPLNASSLQVQTEVGVITQDLEFIGRVADTANKYISQNAIVAGLCPRDTIENMVKDITKRVQKVSISYYIPLLRAAAIQMSTYGSGWALGIRQFIVSELVKAVIFQAFNRRVPGRMMQLCYWHLSTLIEFTVFSKRITADKKWDYVISCQTERTNNAADLAQSAAQARASQ